MPVKTQDSKRQESPLPQRKRITKYNGFYIENNYFLMKYLTQYFNALYIKIQVEMNTQKK